jgi:hypothetical protein
VRDTREAVIRETERLIQLAKELHASLRVNETVYRKTLKKLRLGDPVSETLEGVDAKAARQQLNDSLGALEQCRHQVRRSLIAAGLAEGMTIADTGRAWGISRQLASRYAREIREGTEGPESRT